MARGGSRSSTWQALLFLGLGTALIMLTMLSSSVSHGSSSPKELRDILFAITKLGRTQSSILARLDRLELSSSVALSLPLELPARYAAATVAPRRAASVPAVELAAAAAAAAARTAAIPVAVVAAAASSPSSLSSSSSSVPPSSQHRQDNDNLSPSSPSHSTTATTAPSTRASFIVKGRAYAFAGLVDSAPAPVGEAAPRVITISALQQCGLVDIIHVRFRGSAGHVVVGEVVHTQSKNPQGGDEGSATALATVLATVLATAAATSATTATTATTATSSSAGSGSSNVRADSCLSSYVVRFVITHTGSYTMEATLEFKDVDEKTLFDPGKERAQKELDNLKVRLATHTMRVQHMRGLVAGGTTTPPGGGSRSRGGASFGAGGAGGGGVRGSGGGGGGAAVVVPLKTLSRCKPGYRGGEWVPFPERPFHLKDRFCKDDLKWAPRGCVLRQYCASGAAACLKTHPRIAFYGDSLLREIFVDTAAAAFGVDYKTVWPSSLDKHDGHSMSDQSHSRVVEYRFQGCMQVRG